ncbi:hypothetical protein FJTKL_11189 [Diaporthe vaccinii]|uniref:MADS-box domain-containing protein n=1 Tax=Diaporthe vaccinii TaxID=105482 RepID=A0ABR4EI80_9PEZI
MARIQSHFLQFTLLARLPSPRLRCRPSEHIFTTMRDSQAFKAVKSQQNTARNRRRTLLKKAHELHKLCSAEVFLVVYKSSKFYVYSSNDNNPKWPPPLSEIQLTYPLPEIYHPSRMGDLEQVGEQAADRELCRK